MKKQTGNAIAVGIAVLPLLFLAAIYDQLPPTIPMHFGADFQPDRYGPRAEIWIVSGLLTTVAVGVYFLFANLHRIDPKQQKPELSPLFRRFGFGLLLFMALLNLMIIFLVRGTTAVQSFLFPLLGLFFAFTGYFFSQVTPNYFAGFRLPWTLSDDENWRRTHRLGGRLWLGGGVLIAVICSLLPVSVAIYVFMAIIGLMVCIPCIYSYHFFKTHRQA